jgi:hypothetical protein
VHARPAGDTVVSVIVASRQKVVNRPDTRVRQLQPPLPSSRLAVRSALSPAQLLPVMAETAHARVP